MKKTILIFFTLCGSCLFGESSASAQTVPVHKGTINVRMDELIQRGDSLYVSMVISAKGRNMLSYMSADFIPILTADRITMKLPSVSVMGRDNYRNYRRAMALMNKLERGDYESHKPYAIIRDTQGSQTVNYNVAVPFEPWMADAQLSIRREDCGYGKANFTDICMQTGKVEALQVVVTSSDAVTPHLAYVELCDSNLQERSVQGEALLDFASSSIYLNPNFGHNYTELQKITVELDKIRNDKRIQLKQISLEGYASPEGTLARNEYLSEGRTNALKRYLMMRYNFPASVYEIRFGGEDWDGLVKLVEASDMPAKNEVRTIIENIPVMKSRELMLMLLHGGDSYRYMLREMFPSLRRVVFRVDYTILPLDIGELREIAKMQPQNLTANELSMAAHSYEKGSQESDELFATAARIYPEDCGANINAAVAAIGRRDFVGAERCLRRVKASCQNPELENARGLIVLLRDGDYNTAERHFKLAHAAGLDAATRNLEEIARLRTSEKQMRRPSESDGNQPRKSKKAEK